MDASHQGVDFDEMQCPHGSFQYTTRLQIQSIHGDCKIVSPYTISGTYEVIKKNSRIEFGRFQVIEIFLHGKEFLHQDLRHHYPSPDPLAHSHESVVHFVDDENILRTGYFVNQRFVSLTNEFLDELKTHVFYLISQRGTD